MRWLIVSLVFLATTVNYVDRQVLSVLQKTLQDTLKFSNAEYGWITASFLWAYAFFHPIAGRFIDRVGIRLGFTLAIVVWSVGACSHALAGFLTGGSLRLFGYTFGGAVLMLMLSRFLLGVGEAGNFPAAIKTVAEWFPQKERALATGFFNAGTNVGAMIAPVAVYYIVKFQGWQGAFLMTGALGFFWIILWLKFYYKPAEHPRLSKEEYAHIQSDHDENNGQRSPPTVPFLDILARRQAWGFILGKALTDPIWWFYLFWLPGYLVREKGFTQATLAGLLWLPYLLADFGSVGGGWLSSHLIRKGWSVDFSRKTAMLCAALCMPIAILALTTRNNWLAMCLIGVACAGHQAWSANLFTLSSDTFPKQAVASVVGLGQTGGAVTGAIFQIIIGIMVDRVGYRPLFFAAGGFHLTALVLICLIFGRIQPIAFPPAAAARLKA
ncbi:MAG: MFS transporter [Acidobacteria bacterium]|nr:MFS transporter [Acidobacteriota bacterium]MBI3655692.1 MFS transporter [Acidobacteriota bacterium]